MFVLCGVKKLLLFVFFHYFVTCGTNKKRDNLTNIITISKPRDGLRIVWESVHLARENCRLAFVDQFCPGYV